MKNRDINFASVVKLLILLPILAVTLILFLIKLHLDVASEVWLALLLIATGFGIPTLILAFHHNVL